MKAFNMHIEGHILVKNNSKITQCVSWEGFQGTLLKWHFVFNAVYQQKTLKVFFVGFGADTVSEEMQVLGEYTLNSKLLTSRLRLTKYDVSVVALCLINIYLLLIMSFIIIGVLLSWCCYCWNFFCSVLFILTIYKKWPHFSVLKYSTLLPNITCIGH